ncbi:MULTISPECIES: glycosyltransferase [unclassified Sinorhizobium]|uniref:glycosyltransferase n=1 Tax=unclassified Sinorhizobium TaxID=2613772 RepID=UPI0024C3DDF1|nr:MULTISPECIES: glycosyltransferase [unclassified Sinorhizobium]MDK1374007.1 glycosyltransferase [Sinorhizobium sp. 6-70]MDK1477420.1 glycosyltransferase [Sinorhizobium sp. 6-117]
MISVIIPHLNQPEALRFCLRSLCGQEGVRQPVEFIVVDNGSKAKPTAICSSFPAVRLLSQPIPGPGPARNLGASYANGEILAFIDADCIADANWLGEIERRFLQDPQIAVLGGDVRIAYQDPCRLTLLEAYESVFAYRMKEYIARQGFTGTGNLAVRREVFLAVGPFGGIEIAEDRDWGQRALGQGYRTHYCPNMIVYHPARRTFGDLARKWRRHTIHDFARIQSKSGWRLRWVLRSVAVALSPPAELVRIASSERLKGWRPRALAFLGVVLIRFYRSGIMLALAAGVRASELNGGWNLAAPSAPPRDRS